MHSLCMHSSKIEFHTLLKKFKNRLFKVIEKFSFYALSFKENRIFSKEFHAFSYSVLKN